jgi:hypothetical protein
LSLCTSRERYDGHHLRRSAGRGKRLMVSSPRRKTSGAEREDDHRTTRGNCCIDHSRARVTEGPETTGNLRLHDGCAAARISSTLNGSTNKFGRLQVSATKFTLVSVLSPSRTMAKRAGDGWSIMGQEEHSGGLLPHSWNPTVSLAFISTRARPGVSRSQDSVSAVLATQTAA